MLPHLNPPLGNSHPMSMFISYEWLFSASHHAFLATSTSQNESRIYFQVVHDPIGEPQ